MSSWYNKINGAQPTMASQHRMTPFQIFQAAKSAMSNPAYFIKQVFPDIPDDIMNNPDEILKYLQSSRNISDQQIQEISRIYGRG